MKRLFHYPWRLLYRLTCWSNYPTSRERLWNMYALGKAQGVKEALKDLPIVQVQPRQVTTKPVELHLAPGVWTRQWHEAHKPHLRAYVYPLEEPEPNTGDDSWLNAAPVKKLDENDIKTEEMPAVVRLLHERRNGRG